VKPLKLFVVLSAALAIGLFAVGCGSDDDSSVSITEPAPVQPADSPETSTDDAATVGAEVDAINNTFDPSSVTISAGESVKWTNADAIPHDVVSEDIGMDGKLPEAGSEFVFTFDEAGTFAYVCTLHPGMEGTVVVE